MPSRGQPRGRRPGAAPVAAAPTPIPYDYGVTFKLEGKPGKLHDQVLSIAPDGAFVAVAIGYGFAEDRLRPLVFPRPAQGLVNPKDVPLSDLPIEALIEGFCLEPKFGASIFNTNPSPRAQLNGMVRRVKTAARPTFLFSIIDTATGRELQDEPTHNLASLGIATGERPFRALASPVSFLPRSSLRLQVIEQSTNTIGRLDVVFYGYRLPFEANCPEPAVRAAAGAHVAMAPPVSPARVVPFDYVASLDLTGEPFARQEAEVTVAADGDFVATAVGYGLAVADLGVSFGGSPPALQLSKLTLGDFPPDALMDGIRIRPEMHRLAFKDNGDLNTALPASLLDKVFERLNRPEEVSFAYSIFDSGAGHDLQNIALNNIAGLGSAGGERPFKRLAAPLRLRPSATLRVEVTELFGRGRLFIVFQGYKHLGGRPQ